MLSSPMTGPLTKPLYNPLDEEITELYVMVGDVEVFVGDERVVV